MLSNDLATNCFSYNQPAHGSVAPAYNGAPQGLLEYTPAPGFIGVDEFTYQIYGPGCQGEPETATVYVFVNNFEPDRSTFHISTPKMTPIIIGFAARSSSDQPMEMAAMWRPSIVRSVPSAFRFQLLSRRVIWDM